MIKTLLTSMLKLLNGEMFRKISKQKMFKDIKNHFLS